MLMLALAGAFFLGNSTAFCTFPVNNSFSRAYCKGMLVKDMLFHFAKKFTAKVNKLTTLGAF